MHLAIRSHHKSLSSFRKTSRLDRPYNLPYCSAVESPIPTLSAAITNVIAFSSGEAPPLLRIDLPAPEPYSDEELLAAALKSIRALLCSDPSKICLPPGTPFQRRVWAALLSIPAGQTCTYSELAVRIGAPAGARRAVAQACGANRLALLVPCHRVVPANAWPGGYYWGSRWKQALLHAERALVGLSRDSHRAITSV